MQGSPYPGDAREVRRVDVGPIGQKWPIERRYCLACGTDCTDAYVEWTVPVEVPVAHACLEHARTVQTWMEDRYPGVTWGGDGDRKPTWTWACALR